MILVLFRVTELSSKRTYTIKRYPYDLVILSRNILILIIVIMHNFTDQRDKK